MTTSSRNQSTRGPKPMLTLEQCERIYKLSTVDKIIDKEIGIIFNVSQATVGRVIRHYLKKNRKRGQKSMVSETTREAMYHDRYTNNMKYKDISSKYNYDLSYCQRLVSQYKEDLARKNSELVTLKRFEKNSVTHTFSESSVVSISLP